MSYDTVPLTSFYVTNQHHHFPLLFSFVLFPVFVPLVSSKSTEFLRSSQGEARGLRFDPSNTSRSLLSFAFRHFHPVSTFGVSSFHCINCSTQSVDDLMIQCENPLPS